MEQSEQEAEADDNISTEAARESAAGLDEDIAKAEKEIRLLQLRKEAAQLKREIGDLQRECPSTRPMNRDWRAVRRGLRPCADGIANGFRITDGKRLCETFNANYMSTSTFHRAVELQIKEEIENGRYLIVPKKPTMVSPLGAIPKDNGKVRLIHDCSTPPGYSVNDNYTKKLSPRFESVKKVAASIGKGWFMAKLDLSQAYRSVAIHPDDYQATGIGWRFKGNRDLTWLVDTRLPFGSCASVEIFYRLTQAVKRMMVRRGVANISVYLDDFLVAAESEKECMDALKELIKLVRQLGFGVNWNKVVEPTQCLVYLGVKIDTVRGVLSVPAEKCEEMRTTLLNFSQRRRLSKRQLSSLCGKLSWVVQVVHAGSCFLRPLFDLLNALEKPHHKVRVSADTVRILLWWRGALLKLPDFQLWRSCTNGWIIETDASSAGGGAILRNGSGMVDWLCVNWDLDAGGKFKDKHITYKEAIVPLLAMVRWGAFLNDSSVVVYSDSNAAVGMINRGCCRQPELQPQFQTAMLIAVRRGVEVRAFHVPGWYHVFADPCSRLHAVDKMRDFLFRTPDRLSKRCAFILGNAYAPRTKRSYRSQLASWLRFCNSRHLTPLRAEPVHVAEYLAELSTRLSAFRSCQAYANAVSLYFRALGRSDPCESPMVKLVLRGLR
uniref:Reverse transcriptase domain-containing protein n=2 Tax=Macrostomum lignano TaxID=282301 RepID=A0A1I8HAA6_9PLAT